MMHILPRYARESIRIGDEIVITAIEIKGNQVRIGFAAPEDVEIVREELLMHQPGPADADRE